MDAYVALGTSLHSLLKPQGYRKRKLTWNKRDANRIAVLQVQKSQWAEPNEATFTINLGICFPAVYAACWNEELPEFVNEVRCYPRSRIGHVLGRPKRKSLDIWWKTDRRSGYAKTVEEVCSMVREHALPFLNDLNSVEAAIERMSQTSRRVVLDDINLAVMHCLTRQDGIGQRMLTDLAQSSDHWRPRINEILERLGRQSNEPDGHA